VETPPSVADRSDLTARRLAEIAFSAAVGLVVFFFLSFFIAPSRLGLGLKLLELVLLVGVAAVIVNAVRLFSPQHRRGAAQGLALGLGAVVLCLGVFALVVLLILAIVSGVAG
jgi:hypothetical protein